MKMYVQTNHAMKIATPTQILQSIAVKGDLPCNFIIDDDEHIADLIQLPCWPQNEEVLLALLMDDDQRLIAHYLLHVGVLDSRNVPMDQVVELTQRQCPAKLLLVHRYASVNATYQRVDVILSKALERAFRAHPIVVEYKVFGLEIAAKPTPSQSIKKVADLYVGPSPAFHPAQTGQVFNAARAVSAQQLARGTLLDDPVDLLSWAQIYSAPIKSKQLGAMFLDDKSFLLDYQRIAGSLSRLKQQAQVLDALAQRCSATEVVVIDGDPRAMQRAQFFNAEHFGQVARALLSARIQRVQLVAVDATQASSLFALNPRAK